MWLAGDWEGACYNSAIIPLYLRYNSAIVFYYIATMSKKVRKRSTREPDPPSNEKYYVLVKTRETSYWRRKRGTLKKAGLNEAFRKSAQALALSSPAAKRIKGKLEEYIRGLDTGRFIANVSAKLRKTWVKNGTWNFSLLNRYEVQPYHHLEDLLKQQYVLVEKNGELTVRIPITHQTINRHSPLVTNYYFDFILLSGDPSKRNGLRIESETSSLYQVESKLKTECKLSLGLPKKNPWMALLKVSCLEGNEMAHHPTHYGMKVVEVG
jgi:hypothetical protein